MEVTPLSTTQCWLDTVDECRLHPCNEVGALAVQALEVTGGISVGLTPAGTWNRRLARELD
jgi:hypothetical protein